MAPRLQKPASKKGQASTASQSSSAAIPDVFRDLLREERRMEIKATQPAARPSTSAPSTRPSLVSTPPRRPPQHNDPTNGKGNSNGNVITPRQANSSSATRLDQNMVVSHFSPGKRRFPPLLTSNRDRNGELVSSRAIRPEDAIECALQHSRSRKRKGVAESLSTIGPPKSYQESSRRGAGHGESKVCSSFSPMAKVGSNHASVQTSSQEGGKAQEPRAEASLKRRRSNQAQRPSSALPTPCRDIEAVREGKKRKVEKKTLRDSPNSSPASTRPPSASRSRSASPSKRSAFQSQERVVLGVEAGTQPLQEPQVVEDDDFGDTSSFDESDSDDDSDFDWEDVEIFNGIAGPTPSAPNPSAQVSDQIHIEFDAEKSEALINPEVYRQKKRQKRSIAATRETRVLTHKLHLLCLIWHGAIRNSWCNTVQLQAQLATLLTSKIKKCFHLKPEWSNSQRNQVFVNGLTFAMQMWSETFRITERGLRVAQYSLASKEHNSDFGVPADLHNQPAASKITRGSLEKFKLRFFKAAEHLSGSPDVGAQLLCALLRGAGLEVRLVFSVQVLPLSGPKPEGRATAAKSQGENTNGNTFDRKVNKQPKVERIYLDRPNGGAEDDSAFDPYASTLRRDQKPVFWVEVLNPNSNRWIPVDAMSTLSVNRPAALDPPISLSKINVMTYVLAYEADGTVVDVTRRYSKTFNSRTRRLRVDSIESERQWYLDCLKSFARRPSTDRDRLEEVELKAKEMAEGIPQNLQGFRNHPYYALRRHLRRNEVIHPGREIGRVSIGSNLSNHWEAVYPRSEVYVVRSADRWYRQGLDIKPGELPLKIIQRKSIRRATNRGTQDHEELELDPDSQENLETVALFAEFQTELYIPPPAVNGQVPKNVFGNIDIYVPSMVPKGATHITNPQAFRAAKLLEIDFADVITGFNFSGGRAGATAIKNGIIVASEFAPAVEAVLESIEYEDELRRPQARKEELTELWREIYRDLEIRDRVNIYRSVEERKADEREWEENWGPRIRAEVNEAVRIRQAEAEEAIKARQAEARERRMREQNAELERKLTQILVQYQQRLQRERKKGNARAGNEMGFDCSEGAANPDPEDQCSGAGGFIPADEDDQFFADHGGGFIPTGTVDSYDGGGFVPEDGGGFIPEDGGGFIPENRDCESSSRGGGFIVSDNDGKERGRNGFVFEDPSETTGDTGNGTRTSLNSEAEKGEVVTERALMSEKMEDVNEEASFPHHRSFDSALDEDMKSAAAGSAASPPAFTVDSSTGTTSSARSKLEKLNHDSAINCNVPFALTDALQPATKPHSSALGLELGQQELRQSSPASDHGSLISHDPEDEDGVPMWLMSDE